MRILIVSSYFSPHISAALIFLKDLAEELVKRDHEVILAIDSRYKKLYSVKGAKIRWFNSIKGSRYSLSTTLFESMNVEADVIFLNGYRSFQTDFGSIFSLFKKIPMVLSPHGSLMAWKFIANSFIEKLPYYIHDIITLKIPVKTAKIVITTSNSEYQDAIDYGVSKDRIRLVPLSFSKPTNTSLHHKKQNVNKNLLFVGRIVPNKNLETILQALSIVHKKIPDLKLNILGEEIPSKMIGDMGCINKLKQTIIKLNLEDHVNFLGWKSGNELWEIYKNSDILICASVYENFSMPHVEAASFGLPIISTDVGVAREIIGNMEGGQIVK